MNCVTRPKFIALVVDAVPAFVLFPRGAVQGNGDRDEREKGCTSERINLIPVFQNRNRQGESSGRHMIRAGPHQVQPPDPLVLVSLPSHAQLNFEDVRSSSTGMSTHPIVPGTPGNGIEAARYKPHRLRLQKKLGRNPNQRLPSTVKHGHGQGFFFISTTVLSLRYE